MTNVVSALAIATGSLAGVDDRRRALELRRERLERRAGRRALGQRVLDDAIACAPAARICRRSSVTCVFEERGRRWPVIVSGTITDASGRTLSGQVTEAFWNSIRHVHPLAVGLNCALGAEEIRPYVAELSRIADCFVSCHPNQVFQRVRRVRRDPGAHGLGRAASPPPRAWSTSSAAAAARPPSTSRRSPPRPTAMTPRVPVELAPAMRLSGLERLTITDDSLFVNVGERTNITRVPRGSASHQEGD